ncbi:hypothetical protein Tco_1191934 [Tanacetum coccineum]
MLAPKGSTFNGRPTFANPMYLKKTQFEKPCLYVIPYDQSDLANRLVPDREETLTLEKEGRSKLNKDKVRPYDYTKLNSLYEIFKPPTQEDHVQLAQPNEAMNSDHKSLELEIHDHNNEPSSSKLVSKVVPPADKTATSRQGGHVDGVGGFESIPSLSSFDDMACGYNEMESNESFLNSRPDGNNNLGDHDLYSVDLQHSAIWMAGVYLMILMQFLEIKVAMELTRLEFVEAQEDKVPPKSKNDKPLRDKKHFNTLTLNELRSPDFNLFSDQEYSEEEVVETIAETMEQYMSKTRADYGSGVARPKIKDNDNFELKGQFLKELRTNTFSGSDHEDTNEHIEKVLEIVDLFHILNITIDQVMLRAFPMSLTRAILDSRGAIPSKTVADAKVAIQEMAEYSQKWHNGTSRSRSTKTFNGLAAIQVQLNNLGREIKKVNEKVYAAQVGCEQCQGPHYTKDCPLKKEGKPLKEAYYTQFDRPFQGEGYKVAAP